MKKVITIFSIMREMCSAIRQTLAEYMDYPLTTKPTRRNMRNSDSTFISPKFVQTVENKPIRKWIISVGKYEGFISGDNWIMAQGIQDDIAERYNCLYHKTNALLARLVYCPYCSKRLSVISESDRRTNGKLRFKYVCLGYRKKECNFKVVGGVLLDEFLVQQLSDLSDEISELFQEFLTIKIEDVIVKSQSSQEYTTLARKRNKLIKALQIRSRISKRWM